MQTSTQTAIVKMAAQAEISDLKLKYAGAIGLLCQCSVHLGNGDEADELRECIEQAVQDWCTKTGWRMRKTVHRIDVEPPQSA